MPYGHKGDACDARVCNIYKTANASAAAPQLLWVEGRVCVQGGLVGVGGPCVWWVGVCSLFLLQRMLLASP